MSMNIAESPTLTVDQVPPHHRANRPRWLQATGRFLSRLLGWQVRGRVPDDHRVVAAAAPHTSNWDFIIALLLIVAIDLRVNVLMKDTAFLPGVGWLYRKLGFLPVNRSNPKGFVEDIAAKMTSQGVSIVVVTPEGTRKKVDNWKTGFIRIALASRAKIMAVTVDYRLKEVELNKAFTPSPDIDWELAHIKSFCQGVTPKHPEKFQ